jgi:hypothetical protein
MRVMKLGLVLYHENKGFFSITTKGIMTLLRYEEVPIERQMTHVVESYFAPRVKSKRRRRKPVRPFPCELSYRYRG